MEILKVTDLKKTRGKTEAVKGISFGIKKGEIVSILGPNGAGKTTTLECIEGLLKPDSGEIVINTGNIGIQLQSSALPQTLTVREAMRLFCAYRMVPLREDLLQRFGLTESSRVEFSKLSTGQQRRLALALALIHDPQIIFLDEPSAGLDVASRVELHRIILELRAEGKTIILASHDMAEAENLSDRIIILLNGKIIEEGTPMQLTSSAGSYSKVSVKTEKNSLHKIPEELPRMKEKQQEGGYSIFFCSDAGKTAGFILDYLKKNNDSLIDLRIERPTLEERFIEITGATA